MAEAIKTAETPAKKSTAKPDLATLAGLFLGFGGIVGGLLFEGGKIKDILQFTAAMIVLGGTIGAVLVSTPLRTVVGGLRRLRAVVLDSSPALGGVIEEMIGYATKARKN